MQGQSSKVKNQKYNLKIKSFKTFNFILVFLTFNFLLLILPVAVNAQDSLGQAQVTPASPLYFLKSIREMMELKFASITKIRAYRQLEFSTRRIREVRSLVKENQELIEPTLVKYQSHLGELKGLVDISDQKMMNQVGGEIALHLNVVQELYGNISSDRAKRSIRATAYYISKWDEEIINKLTLSKRLVPGSMTSSKLSACQFLSFEASSSALNEVERTVLTKRAQLCLTPKQ